METFLILFRGRNTAGILRDTLAKLMRDDTEQSRLRLIVVATEDDVLRQTGDLAPANALKEIEKEAQNWCMRWQTAGGWWPVPDPVGVMVVMNGGPTRPAMTLVAGLSRLARIAAGPGNMHAPDLSRESMFFRNDEIDILRTALNIMLMDVQPDREIEVVAIG